MAGAGGMQRAFSTASGASGIGASASQASASRSRQSNAPVFRAELDSAQLVYNTLRGLANGKKDQHAVCEVDPEGLRFVTTDPSLVAQGSANFLARMFDSWEVRSADPAGFRINLTLLLNCLATLGNQIHEVSLQMAYFDADEVFTLRMIEGQAVTECKIRTLVDVGADPHATQPGAGDQGHLMLRSDFKAVPVLNKCVIMAEQLKEAFSLLSEMNGAATVSVLLSPESPFLRFSTQGQQLTSSVDFPNGDESLVKINCQEAKECSYRLSFLQQAVEGDTRQSYVDFYILADAEEVDSDHEAAGTAGQAGEDDLDELF